MSKFIALLLLLSMSACTQLKVVEIDPTTGHFPSSIKADIVKNEKYNLDELKSLILISSEDILVSPGDFVVGQVKNIKYFDKIINLDELQKTIVQQGLEEKIPSTADKIGIYNAYKHYKPFLWLRVKIRQEGKNQYMQFILTDPKSLNDIFIAEKYINYTFIGISDHTTLYPLCNALIDYIKNNSKTYKQFK